MKSLLLVTTTFENRDEALQLGHHLLQKRLVACAQVGKSVISQYWWQGKVVETTEYRLEMKTVRGLWNKLSCEISARHPYDTPEIVATSVTEVTEGYQQWLLEELKQ